jgi:anti-sigma regulatory factor (Ser/Thr protein kinase)
VERTSAEEPTPAVPVSTTPPAAAVGCAHGAAVVGSEAELLAVALPFLDEGLRAGDLLALTCPPETVDLVFRELGERAVAVESDPRMSLLGSRAPDALIACRGALERAAAAGSGRLRVLAEVDFGAEPADWREGQRFESVFNELMVGAQVSVVCLYDRRRLPGAVVDSAAATHPRLVSGSAWSASPDFREPADYVRSLPRPREPAENAEPVLVIGDAPALADLRHRLGAALAEHVPDVLQREDLHLGVSEVAANAFRHGRRPVAARIWTDQHVLVCAITDSGTRFDNPMAGYLPARGFDLGRGGMGLWLARKLWDHVDVLGGAAGLTVRLSARLR